MAINVGFQIAAVAFIVMIALIAIIKSRYKRFTNREFVLRFRNGELVNKGYGGGYFLLPLIDELIILSTTIQNLEIDVSEKIITSENQDVRVSGFVVYRIEDPVKAYQSISGSQNQTVMRELNKTLEDLVESIIRTTVASLKLDQVLRERSLIIEAIMTELLPVVSPMGIKISTAEIRHVEVLDEQLFRDLQEKYRQEAKLNAEKTKINTDREIAKSRAESEEDVQKRELSRDRSILQEKQKVQEADEERRIAIERLEKEREAKMAEITKKRLEVEAETKLMEMEYEAESKKRQEILQQIDVEAEKQRRMAKAEADAIKTAALARKEAAELDADAEAVKLRKVAEAKREALLAEAEGKKALLLAEAEGLREKVKAQGLVNESMIMQELVKQLPSIASSMKVGDINWLNMGGNTDGSSDSPLGIIPKNLLHIMTLSKSFGLDVENLIRTIRGKEPLPEIDRINEENETEEQLVPIIYDRDMITNAIALSKEDGTIEGFDVDHNGEVDFTLPSGVKPIVGENGRIIGLDLDNDGTVDFEIPEKIKAIDKDGNGIIDGLSLDGNDIIDINLNDLLTIED